MIYGMFYKNYSLSNVYAKIGTIMSCQCDVCNTRRERFPSIMNYMSGNMGVAKKKIERNVDVIPNTFIDHMKSLLKRMNKGGAARFLTPDQREFFKIYKRVLRSFVRPDSHGKQVLAVKRQFMNRKMPFVQALGKLYTENPKLFHRFMNDMVLHD